MEVECAGFPEKRKGWSQDSFLDELLFLPALCLVEGEQYKRGVLQLLLEKAAPGSSACGAGPILFLPGCVFLPSGPVRQGESCLPPGDGSHLHLSVISPGSVGVGPLLPPGLPVK